MSVKQEILIRRIVLKDGSAYGIRPSFLMPYMTSRTADVEGPLFLRMFGVPFWALARVFGGDSMSWYRLECGLGRFSVVGTTVRSAALPEHLLADEHHQVLDGQKVYIAKTVGQGCCLGAEPAETAGTDDLKAAHEVFKSEARDISLRPQNRQHRRLEVDTSSLENAVLEGSHPSVLLARVAQDPRPGQALEGVVRGSLSARLGSARRAQPPEFRATAAFAPAVGHWTTHGGCPGECAGPVQQARPLVDRVPPPRRPPHQQHAGRRDARNEPLLRPRRAPARLARGLPVALPSVGVVELRTLASGDNAR